MIFELLVGEGLLSLNMIENIGMRSFVWFHITQIYQLKKHYFLWWNVCIQGICFVSCECYNFNHDYIQPLDEKGVLETFILINLNFLYEEPRHMTIGEALPTPLRIQMWVPNWK
jgi:hypothetical protein